MLAPPGDSTPGRVQVAALWLHSKHANRLRVSPVKAKWSELPPPGLPSCPREPGDRPAEPQQDVAPLDLQGPGNTILQASGVRGPLLCLPQMWNASLCPAPKTTAVILGAKKCKCPGISSVTAGRDQGGHSDQRRHFTDEAA